MYNLFGFDWHLLGQSISNFLSFRRSMFVIDKSNITQTNKDLVCQWEKSKCQSSTIYLWKLIAYDPVQTIPGAYVPAVVVLVNLWLESSWSPSIWRSSKQNFKTKFQMVRASCLTSVKLVFLKYSLPQILLMWAFLKGFPRVGWVVE